ncbi:Nn.00g012070.m01.CDS01 [Neocucurbitaria sp. VM-36]
MPALGAFPTVLLLFVLASFLPLTSAVFLNFENCLERVYLPDKVPYLQFTPMYVWASFNTTAPTHTLNLTVYGNVSGQTQVGDYPPPDDVSWSDPNNTFGKIVNVDPSANKFTTLFSNFRVLTYSAWSSPATPFCESIVNGSCPLGPSFGQNASDPYTLPAMSVAHDFSSTYSFTTWSATMRVLQGNTAAQPLSCVSASITPDLGRTLSDAIRYMPAAVLALVAVATIFAATCSPWGTSNVFRWTSNYGRDEDLLRLVTPGFGDCLQYIQFVVLAGSLSLNYPGFFQPVVSQASWSVLLFNQSFVSHGNGSRSLVDGIYFANGTYGLTRLGQYVGMTRERDIWACMAIFLLVLIGIAILLTQLGFLGRWLSRQLTKTQDGDLTGKNWSFTAGNIVRIVFNYFMLPVVSISLFQLVVGPRSPGSVVAAAVILLILVAGVATWIFWFIFTTRPRAHLFDDLPTVLTYGPLYNTYSDDAAPFAFIPVLLTVIRGVAIGAIQPSGIAQIIILAICEVILILTLHAFRPFQSNTSMNAYHTFFSVVRLTCILLSVAFVPSLAVTEAPKGWIGYVILLLHAIVLIFGFFLNSLQTIIEVAARLGGVGADQRGGLATVFGKRELSKRTAHRTQRSSLNSNAAMLAHDENKNIQLMDSRSRSLSASSAVLLNGPYDRDSNRASVGFDQFSGEYNMVGSSPGTPGTNATPFTFLGGNSNQSSRRPTMGTTLDAADPYYRPPRPRKHTMDSIRPEVQGKGPAGSADIADAPYSDDVDIEAGDVGEGPSRTSGTPAPAYLRMNRDDSDPNLERRNKTDYSVRESDFYYGLRGPALSSQPTRKLKTGPADPMSPVSSATGWFKSLNLLGGRKKEKSKGFEVVRSTRMPPQMMAVDEDDEESPEVPQEPYRDSPDTPSPPRNKIGPGVASAGVLAGGRRLSTDSDSEISDEEYERGNRVSAIAPALGPIETGGGIELPSRIGSRASRVTQRQGPPSRAPTIPRKNSRRTRSTEAAVLPGSNRLSTVMDSAPVTPHYPSPHNSQHLQPTPSGLPIRLPFGSTEPSPSPERSPERSAASSIYRNDGISDFNVPPPPIGAQGERPLSTGYVQHHVTKDSLHSDGYDAGNHLEASAEFVERSRSGSTQRSERSQRPR